MDYNEIRTIQDIKIFMVNASSEDGESLNFELKGSNGETKFQKEQKKLLAKEICAFANTYGGVLCFHSGRDTEIVKFSPELLSTSFNSIEGWLRDSLEPKVMGMELKIIEDTILINIPESKTKPHRTAETKEYYYRHSSSSVPMPEIMISSMYRSQDFLNYTSSISASKSDSQISLYLNIQNHSNISGSKPKVQIQIFSDFGKQIEFGTNPYFAASPIDSFQTSISISTLSIPCNGMIETNVQFSERILYPKDWITLTIFSKPDSKIKELRYILIRMDCMFKESVRQTSYKIIDFDVIIRSNVLMSTKDNTESKVINAFKTILDQ